MQNYNHSPVLFVGDDGLPMEFYIRMHASKKSEIRELIEHGGGIVQYTEGKNVIRLVPAGSKVLRFRADGLTLTVQYIYDCVKQNRLLDFSSYVVRVFSAKTSDISDEDEDDDFRKVKRPSALPAPPKGKQTLRNVKQNEKVQRGNQKRPVHWTNGVKEDSSVLPHRLSGGSYSGLDRSDESISLLQKQSPVTNVKVPDRSSYNEISISNCVQSRLRNSRRIYDSDSTDSDAVEVNFDAFDVGILRKSRNYARTSTQVSKQDEPQACGSGTATVGSLSVFKKNLFTASRAAPDFSQPSSSFDSHVSPTPEDPKEDDSDEVPYRREIDLDITEAACVLKDIENLVLFCKLSEDPAATADKVEQINRMKRMIYKALLASDVEAVLRKQELSTRDKAVLFKYLMCEKHVSPRSATALLSQFADDSRANSKVSNKKS